MLGTILSLVPSIIGLFSSNKASDEYKAELDKIRSEQKISEASLQAKQILAEQATRGLPGYETMKEDINTQTPTTLNEAKDWLTSGGVVDFLARSSAATNKQLRQLDAANEQQKMANINAYAGYLGGPMAAQESDLAARQTQLGIASAYTGAEKAATQNKYMFGMGNALAGIADKDLYELIALLSGKGDYTKPAGDYVDTISNETPLRNATPYNWT